jgi:hypothetical protein
MKRRRTVGDHYGLHFQPHWAGKIVLAEPDSRIEVRSRASRSPRVGPVGRADPTELAGPAVQIDWVDRTKTTLSDRCRQHG